MNAKSISLSLFAVVAFLAMFALQSNVAKADIENGGGNVVGPFFAFGDGTQTQAQAEASGNMFDMLMVISSQLAPGESIAAVIIVTEGYDEEEQEYTIEFMVVIQSNGPPGM